MHASHDGLWHARFSVETGRRRVNRYYRMARALFLGLTTVCGLLLEAGCAPSPIFKYNLQAPPTTLVPIGYAGISDERARFREIFCAIQQDHGSRFPDDRPCDAALHRIADEPEATGNPVYLGAARLPLRFVIIPGLLEECVSSLIRPFSDARPHVESLGFKTDLIMVGGLSGSAQNAAQIEKAAADLPLASGEKLVFIGYSKGAPDVLEAVVRYPALRDRTAAVVTLAGVISGTPLAGEVPEFLKRLADQFFDGKCPPGNGRGIESLSRHERLRWLAANKLPASVRYYSLAAFTEREGISLILRPSYDKLSRVDPRNDSQVVVHDALVPGGAFLGYLNADHWAIALPFSREHPALADTMITRNAFPREVLLEAIARFVEETLLSELDR